MLHSMCRPAKGGTPDYRVATRAPNLHRAGLCRGTKGCPVLMNLNTISACRGEDES